MNKMPTGSGPTIEPYCDNWPEIDDTAYVASTAAIMGSVRIGADVSIWHTVTLRGDANYITIGKGSNIQDNSIVHIDSGAASHYWRLCYGWAFSDCACLYPKRL